MLPPGPQRRDDDRDERELIKVIHYQQDTIDRLIRCCCHCHRDDDDEGDRDRGRRRGDRDRDRDR